MHRDLLVETTDRLIAEGKLVLGTEFDASNPNVTYLGGRPRGVELAPFAKWQAGCVNLVRLLGEAGKAWQDNFASKRNDPANVERMLGTLQAIKESIEHSLLLAVEDLIRAEAFNGLLEQAEYLNEGGYFLAAGVLGRAVLEEHLRSLCEVKKCSPVKAKPTLNDFKDGLYRAKYITVAQLKHIESMAAIGNDAAHNKPELTADDVTRLMRDVRDFLARHSMTV